MIFGIELGLTVAIGLVVLGLAFVLAEILLPTGGLFTILAAAALIGAVVSAFHDSMTTGFSFLLGVMILVPVMIGIGLKVFPNTPLGRVMILGPGIKREEDEGGRSAMYDPEERVAADRRLTALLGKEGVTITPLVPGGSAEIEGDTWSVVTAGEMIDNGSRVRVVDTSGNRLVVQPVAGQPSDHRSV